MEYDLKKQGAYDLSILKQELSDKFDFSIDGLNVVDVIRYFYDQIQIEMIEFDHPSMMKRDDEKDDILSVKSVKSTKSNKSKKEKVKSVGDEGQVLTAEEIEAKRVQ